MSEGFCTPTVNRPARLLLCFRRSGVRQVTMMTSTLDCACLEYLYCYCQIRSRRSPRVLKQGIAALPADIILIEQHGIPLICAWPHNPTPDNCEAISPRLYTHIRPYGGLRLAAGLHSTYTFSIICTSVRLPLSPSFDVCPTTIHHRTHL